MVEPTQTALPTNTPAEPTGNGKVIQYREVEMPPHLAERISNALKYGRDSEHVEPNPPPRRT